VWAKAAPIYQAGPADSALQFLYQFGLLFIAGIWGIGWQGITVTPALYLTQLTLTLAAPQFMLLMIGLGDTARRERTGLLFYLFPSLYVVAYSVIGLRGSLVAEWYLVPLLPFLFAGVIHGLAVVMRRLAPHSAQLSLATAGVLLVASQFVGLNWNRDPSKGLWTPLATWTEREKAYADAARIIACAGRSDSIVAASEIGALGYYGRFRVIDTVGLVSPQALKFYPLAPTMYVTNYAVPLPLITTLKPSYLVTLEVFVRKSVLPFAEFWQDYRPIRKIETSAFGSRGLFIFERLTTDDDAGPSHAAIQNCN